MKTLLISTILSGLLLGGCGYTWRGANNPFQREGIERVYVKAMGNSTLRPGIEAPFTSALVKEFARGRKVKVVTDETKADAIVDSRVVTARSEIGPSTTADHLSTDPAAGNFSDYVIASEYSASATILVSLVRTRDRKVLWTKSLSGAKAYPAQIRFGLAGDTAALIDASQERLALDEVAQTLASDAYDTMFEAF